MRLAFLALIAIGTSFSASAANVASSGTISYVNAYSTQGGGDVVFRMSTNPTGCFGLWLKKADGGFNSLFATLLAAKTAGSQVDISASDTEIWSGSANNYCRVIRIQLN